MEIVAEVARGDEVVAAALAANPTWRCWISRCLAAMG